MSSSSTAPSTGTGTSWIRLGDAAQAVVAKLGRVVARSS
jgi:hypothetical protein